MQWQRGQHAAETSPLRRGHKFTGDVTVLPAHLDRVAAALSKLTLNISEALPQQVRSKSAKEWAPCGF